MVLEVGQEHSPSYVEYILEQYSEGGWDIAKVDNLHGWPQQ
jgi:hypothetical protein